MRSCWGANWGPNPIGLGTDRSLCEERVRTMCSWVKQYVKSPPCRSKDIIPLSLWESESLCSGKCPRLKILGSFIRMDTLTLKLLHVYIYSSASRLGWRLSSHVKQGWGCVTPSFLDAGTKKGSQSLFTGITVWLKMASKLSTKMTSREFSEQASDLSFYSKCQSWGHFWSIDWNTLGNRTQGSELSESSPPGLTYHENDWCWAKVCRET